MPRGEARRLETHPPYDAGESWVLPERIQERLEKILRQIEVVLVDAPVQPGDPLRHVPQRTVGDGDVHGGDQFPCRASLQIVDDAQRRRPITRRGVGVGERGGTVRIEDAQVDGALD